MSAMGEFPQEDPIIFESSGVSFALMGPVGSHRGILARSAHHNLNLAGLDNPVVAAHAFNQRNSLNIFSTRLEPHAIHVSGHNAQLYADGERTAHLTFAWEGIASRSDHRKIEEVLHMTAPDLASALSSRSDRALEWQLSGILLLCEQITLRNARSRRFRLYFLAGALAVYALIGALLIYEKNFVGISY